MAAMSVQQLEERANFCGASDVPALLGLDPFRNITDVYMAKRRLIELKETDSEDAAFGNDAEPFLIDWLAQEVGQPVETGRVAMHPNGILRAQLDGYLPLANQTAEAKTTGIFAGPTWRPEENGWGKPGTDEIPLRFIAQTQVGLMNTKAGVCQVPVLLRVPGAGAARIDRADGSILLVPGAEKRLYVVEELPELQKEILARVEHFWFEHVIPGIPPAEVPSIETLKVVKREPGKSVEIDADLIERYEAIKEQEKLIAVAKEEAKEKLIHALGDADEGYSPFGGVTYYANKNGVRSLSVKERA